MEIAPLDITQLIASLLGIVFTALGTVGALALRHVSKYFGMKVNREADQLLDRVINNGINHAIPMVMGLAEKHNLTKVYIKNEVVRLALNYLYPRVQDTLNHFGLTPDEVKKRIEARYYEIYGVKDLPDMPETEQASPAPVPVKETGTEVIPAGAPPVTASAAVPA